MGAVCKHGVDPRFCSVCLQVAETEQLRPDALKVTAEGKPALLLRIGISSGQVTALVLDGAAGRLATVEADALRSPESNDAVARRATLDQFRRVALQMGYLFNPERTLTTRERTDDGPPRCYSCHAEVSLVKHSLGCTQCQYYVCRCARCICGYTGKNYLGQLFSQFPALPIPRKERLDFVRVVRFCSAVAEQGHSANNASHHR